MTKELALKKPILAHNEKLHVLELREPTYDEIEAIGFPFTVSGDGTIKLDSSVALKYIPVLAGIPRSSAAQMAKLDIFKTCMQILSFFTQSETEQTSDDDSTTSPGSGN
ncbi:phage tail assembly protein [Enterobacter sichuanensis]|uniref:Phage tail assembly protein n=1 Tax=Enterobacter sichuanensis TaxID=2071710 RepID=A0AAE4DXN5_9ENTR|nr:phage tail assembly protein [Enterobacter sichuanensis]MDR9947279.1 phage tail assembly protein [Enterobacter sichuanensis]